MATTNVRPTNVYDVRNISTNFNPCRQRSLSRAQSSVFEAADVIATGDLAAISAASEVDGRIRSCEVSLGYWEPQDDRGQWGCSPAMCRERDDRTVRITCKRGRKAAWLEITYDTPAEANAVIAAVQGRREAWDAWSAEQAGEPTPLDAYAL